MITRRRLLGATAGFALLTALGACADDTDDGAAEPVGDATPETSATPTTGGTRTVRDQYGEVTITGTPVRIVVTGNSESDVALDLGATLLTQGEYSGFDGGIPIWREPLQPSTPPAIWTYKADFDVEACLALNPDIVLAGYDLSQDVYNTLSKQVPTICVPYEPDWKKNVELIATALDREQAGRDLIERTEQAIADARTRHPVLDGKTIGYGVGDLTEVYGIRTLGYPADLGLRLPAAEQALDEDAVISFEKLSVLDGDLLLMTFDSEELQAKYEAMELFKRLPAVRDGRYVGSSAPEDLIAFEAQTPVTIRYALDHLIPRLAAVADGSSASPEPTSTS